VDAEKARQQLLELKRRQRFVRRDDLESVQREDVKVFFAMVGQHQQTFDHTWQQRTLEHKLRADDLIEALKWKHDQQQKELYELLRKKRMPKFSVELLNLRKKQVVLAKGKRYVQAEGVKRKADILEAIEIESIRAAAKQENTIRFKTLLKRQEWDRQALASKLKLEKQALLEAKAQDFTRLKKRLKNAEAELKKAHVRQALQAEKLAERTERKLVPLLKTHTSRRAIMSTERLDPQRPRSGERLLPLEGGGGGRTARTARTARERKSVRDLARMGRPEFDASMGEDSF